MKININDLIKLRNITKIGIIKCKEALIKSNNNLDLAIKYLTEYNNIDNIKEYNTNIKNGLIISKISNNKKYGVILKINNETDFVSNNIEFLNFAKNIVEYCILNKSNNINDINNVFKKEKLYLINKVKENIYINDFYFLEGEYIQSYIHRSKIGVLIKFDKYVDFNIVKQISMHIIFNKPLYISESEIPKYILDNELNEKKLIIKNINPKISEDELNNILKEKKNKFIENILLNKQKFLMDTNIIMGNFLIKNKINIKEFKILEL